AVRVGKKMSKACLWAYLNRAFRSSIDIGTTLSLFPLPRTVISRLAKSTLSLVSVSASSIRMPVSISRQRSAYSRQLIETARFPANDLLDLPLIKRLQYLLLLL